MKEIEKENKEDKLDKELKMFLKPCPFCSSETPMLYRCNRVGSWHVTCNKCNFDGGFVTWTAALERWNERD